jgi:class 3 adenylate cyclase/predicted metal-dependent HD superfamily phosphohydrolase/CheY-like chemotaxis protein
MERFINILIIDSNDQHKRGLKEILSGGGNNILFAQSIHEGSDILKQKEFGMILINIDGSELSHYDLLSEINGLGKSRNIYKIALTEDPEAGAKMVKGHSNGVIDFITYPLNPILVKAKIDVFKSLYYKDQRINQLLSNIFPENVLHDLNTHNKFSPKRVENGVVLFTDFVDFSIKAKAMKPIRLLKNLEHYFVQFDAIMRRYHLEKIKTIGDAYMAIGGVTENLEEPAIRACLAALEIRDLMRNERDIAKALKRDFWEIRIGLHMGPLVAGIIGSNKMSFDVWGDTVNIAARAEQGSHAGCISVTSSVASNIQEYFELESRGEVPIHKRGGNIEMFYLKELKNEFCLYGEGKIASTALRQQCGLSPIDFEHMRNDVVNRLKALLPEDVIYHDISHTLNVEKAAERYARLEGIDEDNILLLRTAALYHDTGFMLQYHHNEEFAIQMAENYLPRFGYSEEQIAIVTDMIRATEAHQEPQSLLAKIMCDADHDYLGRADYYNIAHKLRLELENNNQYMNEIQWIEFQLHYLVNIHRFYTETAQNIRLLGKKQRIAELQKELEKLKSER